MKPKRKIKKYYKTLEELTGGVSIKEWVKSKLDKECSYFISSNGYDLCSSCAHDMEEYNVTDKPIEYHVNHENESLICHNCEIKIKSKRQFEKEVEVAAKYIGTSKNLRKILTEMGFYSTETLGIWKFSKTLSPNNTIEFCIFTRGDFWINEKGKKIYTGNYKEMLVTNFIKILLKIIDKM